MDGMAQRSFPAIKFHERAAPHHPLGDGTFDRVGAKFALPHHAGPARACAEACRVLKPGGRFGFTTWARLEESPFVKLVDDAIQAHANLDVNLPPGPPYYLFENPEAFRSALERAGFDGGTMSFQV